MYLLSYNGEGFSNSVKNYKHTRNDINLTKYIF